MGGNVVALSADTTNRAFGTKNYEDLAFITNDTVRMVITKDGDLLIGSERVVLEGNLEVQGDSVIVNKNLYVLDTTFTRVGFVEETLGVGGDVTIEGATTINNSLAGTHLNSCQSYVVFLRLVRLVGPVTLVAAF